MPRGRPRKRTRAGREVKSCAQAPTTAETTEPDEGGVEEVSTKQEKVEESTSARVEEEVFVEVELDDEMAPSTSAQGADKLSGGEGGSRRSGFPRLFDSEARPVQSQPQPQPTMLVGVKKEKDAKQPRQMIALSPPRTRSATMHQKMVDTMKLEFEEEALSEGHTDFVVSCDECSCKFSSNMELQEHKRGLHKQTSSSTAEDSGFLLCGVSECTHTFTDVCRLIAHLVAFHNMPQYRIRRKNFDSIDKFDAWRIETERTARCTFLSTEGPQGLSNDFYTVTLYCEYCDEWRMLNDSVEAGKERVEMMEKLIGCPAHFTATIDNKKNRATAVGCFSHLGHVKAVAKKTAEPGKTPMSYDFKCAVCERRFRSQNGLTRHMSQMHNHGNPEAARTRPQESKVPSLECGDANCDIVCDTMHTLVQHVSEHHGRPDLAITEYNFPTLQEFEDWKTAMEAETCSKFAKVSGREMEKETTKYYLCHLSGHPNRIRHKKQDSGKLRNRSTKKLGRYCTAYMSLKINKTDGSVHVRGCLSHFGHSFDVRRLPLTENLRKEISDLLLKGLTEDAVLQLVRSRYAENERGYWLQRYEVRNIALKLQRQGLLVGRMYTSMTDWGDEDGYIQMQDGDPMYISVEMPNAKQEHRTYRRVSNQMGESSQYSGQMESDMSKKVPHVMQFIDPNDYSTNGAVVHMSDIDGVMEANDEIFYEDQYDDIDEKRINVISQVVTPQHRRIPIIKEPSATGNPDFDAVMMRIKERIDHISEELKITQDMALAESLLKQLKELESRLVENVGQTTVPVVQVAQPGSRWITTEEYYDDYVDVQDAVGAGHVAVDEAGNSYVVEYSDQDPGTVEVETEEVIT